MVRTSTLAPWVNMTAETWLATSAAQLDEAVESLTFDRSDWALEYTWHGVAALLCALSAEPVDELPSWPGRGGRSGTLAELARSAGQAQSVDRIALVDRIERLSGAGRDAGARARFDAAVAAVTFDACGALERAALWLGVATPGVASVSDRRPAPSESADGQREDAVWNIPRRTALKLLAAGGVASLAACVRAEPATAPASSGAAPGSAPGAVAAATVRASTPLEGLNWPTSDPFLFCAHHVDEYPAGNGQYGPPAASLQGRDIGRDFEGRDNWRMYHGETVPGFPRHPHRGFETVTVVRTGLLDHTDSMGATARYGGGDVQWLTAGGGIQHAEMFPLLRSDAPNPLELFQIWLNLPAADKMVPAYFTMLWHEQIPHLTERDPEGRATELTIAAGHRNGVRPPPPPPNSWASRPESDLAIWSLKMDPGARFELPAVNEGTERALYVHVGNGVRIGEVDVPNLTRVELDGRGPIVVEAGSAQAEILLLQARPIGEPVARRGPFVMNTQEEIRQAYADYQATQFGGWPWPASDPVNGAELRRFARHPDGRLDEPT